MYELTSGAIESIMNGADVPAPVLQVLGTKKIAGTAGSSADRYRLLLSDAVNTYSSAMLATQLNHLVDSNQLENHSVIRLSKYVCNSVQERKVLIILEVDVIAPGSSVGTKLGNPQPYKAGAAKPAEPNNQPPPPKQHLNGYGGGGNAPAPPSVPPANRQPLQQQNNQSDSRPSFYGNKPQESRSVAALSNPPAAQARPTPMFGVKSEPLTPGGSVARICPISSLTPYQNKWCIRARCSQKSNIRTWSNSRGEGKLFSMNLLDESGEIRATAFKEQVDRYFDMVEVGKVYTLSRASVKTANKQYSSVDNDYELTFNSDTHLQLCEEQDVQLPTLNFNFIQINRLEAEQPNTTVDVIGIVKSVEQLTTVTGRQSNKEIKKRDLHIVDDTQAQVRLTLWGSDAESFKGENFPVLAVKGCRLSDWNGRSLSALSSSQVVLNPDIPESHKLRGWYDSVGHTADFMEYKRDGAGAGSQQANWKTFAEVKSEPPSGDQAMYYTTKATIVALRRENCMYMACPTQDCNKKLVDQANGYYRCEKCAQEFTSYKWRMILSMNLADHTDNQWVTAFQEGAEMVLGKTAQELGALKDSNQDNELDEIFQTANFQSLMFKLRAKVETYNDESRLKTVCMQATPINHVEYSKKLISDIEKMAAS